MATGPFSARGLGAVFTSAICLAALAGILTVEVLAPPEVSLGALTVIPVAVAAWLLPTGPAAVVIGVAIAVRLLALMDGVAVLTVGSEVFLLLVVGAALRLAGGALLKLRAQESELKRRAEEIAAAGERERIAAQLTGIASRALFEATLELQAAVSFIGESPARHRVETAVGELDDLQRELRTAIFSR